ncbi:MAG: low-specificity L-threonine aldolase [Desulfobacteraceae bacterium]|jgi:threonine aldolase
MTNPIDLRSDTITKPTDAMRRAMAEAEVGDDVLGDDPTVQKLEALAADMLGKPAALFVTSGTMGNLVSQMVHCRRGDEMILGSESHIFYYEQGGSAAIGNIHSRTVPNQPDGTMAPDDIRAAIRADNIHFPVSRLIVIENTHNRCAGAPIGLDYMHTIRGIADQYGMKIHVDGARIFNAAHALGCAAADLARHADSVTFCLSKGLAAPAGSLVCGNPDFIHQARRVRKVLGGGMRQVGVLAAAGIVALTEMVDRLAEDHANAKRLAVGLSRIAGISIDPSRIQTNIVYFSIDRPGLAAPDLAQRLNTAGVRVLPTGPQQLRAVTQYHICPPDIDAALTIFEKTMASI